MTPPSAISNDITVHGVTDTETVTIPSPLTAAGVMARRAKNAPLKAGIAAATSSDQFKSKVSITDTIGFQLRGRGCSIHSVMMLIVFCRHPGSHWQRGGTVSETICHQLSCPQDAYNYIDRLSTESKARKVSCLHDKGSMEGLKY